MLKAVPKPTVNAQEWQLPRPRVMPAHTMQLPAITSYTQSALTQMTGYHKAIKILCSEKEF